MGLTEELMKSVFSNGRPDMNGGRRGFRFGERRQQGGVRSYLFGDELCSVPAEEDSASLQPLPGNFTKGEEMRIAEGKAPREKQNSMSQLFREQDSAILIQMAFRSYMDRSQRKEEDNKLLHLLPIGRDRSPNVESTNTSHEVLSEYSIQLTSGSPAKGPSCGKSVESRSESLAQGQSFQQDRSTVYPQKQKPRIRVLRKKEEWDNSTISSNVAEMRIKRRLEAVTRRERALAYAFSQQLRLCSTKRPEGGELDVGWSWLERWMATRPSENLSLLSGEENESCGSKEVPLNMGSITVGSKSHRKLNPVSENSELIHAGNRESFLTRRYQKISSTDRPQEPKVSNSKREEQQTRPTNTVTASII